MIKKLRNQPYTHNHRANQEQITEILITLKIGGFAGSEKKDREIE
jgi:hypothetical protein